MDNFKYALKITVKDTELITALRQIAFREGEQRGQIVRRSVRKGVVSGRFDPETKSLTFAAYLHHNHRLNFAIKQGSKSYLQFFKLLTLGLKQCEPAIAQLKSHKLDYALSALKTALLRDKSEETDSTEPELEVHPRDFIFLDEPSDLSLDEHEEIPEKRVSLKSGQSLLVLYSESKTFRVFDRTQTSFTDVQGAISLELEEFVEPAGEESFAGVQTLTFLDRPEAEVTEQGILVSFKTAAPTTVIKQGELFLHWGRYQDAPKDWLDEQVLHREMIQEGEGRFSIHKLLRPAKEGDYGATVWFRPMGSQEKSWLGQSNFGDAIFTVEHGFGATPRASGRDDSGGDEKLLCSKLQPALASFKRFVTAVNNASLNPQVRNLGELLFEITRGNLDLQSKLSSYYQECLDSLITAKTQKAKAKLRTTANALHNLGLGEIVFVAPEGPHATAGGLAQVIIGLSKSLNDIGIATTLITPLYEYSNGSKHLSAEALLAEGVELLGKKVPLEEVDEVQINYGPTYCSGSSVIREFARRVTGRVYCAQREKIRIFFLRHHTLAPTLYSRGAADHRLRAALFLCRGALEILKSPQFGIKPHILVTNDWLTGLVHPLLKADPAYDCPKLQRMQTVHILHNCGRAYQGLFYVNQYGEDLWPIFGLADQHFFGLCDPEDKRYFNLTAAAIFHVGKALLAVSRPYAKQLMTAEGGEGLDKLIKNKRDVVFGISNGVDLTALRLIAWQLGENARETLDFTPLAPEKFTESRLLKRLFSYKEATKLVVQKSNGLAENPEAILISFIGRLAEQKGTALLVEELPEEGVSVLEALLIKYPEVQIIIGGPPSESDPSYQALFRLLHQLTRRYPRRIQGILDFIPHAEALEITLGSDLFLMPSRYEPGGIAQLEALASGTLVVARDVGGISATLVDYDETTEKGNSFLFQEYSAAALYASVDRAIKVFKNRRKRKKLVTEAATEENDWTSRAPLYLAMLQSVAGILNQPDYEYLTSKRDLLKQVQI